MKRIVRSLMLPALGFFTLAADLSAADFLPLAPGNNWTYQEAATGQAFNVEVGFTQYLLNERVYHSLRGYTPRVLLVRINELGNIVFWDEERGTDVLLTSFEIVPGGWFEAPGRECTEMGQPQASRVTHNGPAGNWNVLQILYRTSACADAGDISEQFAENIGMVQRVVTTIAGPRTFNLVHATLGSQIITAGQSGGLTISALPGPQLKTWTATLRLHQTLPSDAILHFPSSQEYDAVLRDAQGNLVWAWSADKSFLQQLHELRLSGRWSTNITVPQPAVPEGASRFFTLEAWLTNNGNEPHFAGTTTLYVPVSATE